MVVGGWMSVDCALHIVELFAAEGGLTASKMIPFKGMQSRICKEHP